MTTLELLARIDSTLEAYGQFPAYEDEVLDIMVRGQHMRRVAAWQVYMSHSELTQEWFDAQAARSK